MTKLKEKCGDLWRKYGIWIPIGLVLAGICIGACIWAFTRGLSRPVDLKSPQYEAGTLSEFDTEGKEVYTAEDGVVTIPAQGKEDAKRKSAVLDTDDTDAIWEADGVVTWNSFTTQDKVMQADGSIGVLTIPKIGISVNVFQAENEIEAMTRGLAHIAYTSSWDGHIGIAGHNINYDLTDGHLWPVIQNLTGRKQNIVTSLNNL